MKTKAILLSALALMSLLVLMSVSASSTAYSQSSTPTPHDMIDGPISAETSRLIADVRAATAGFRDFSGVEKQGYGKFLDCFVNTQVGGMGQHYVNGDLVADDEVDPMKPEALVFEPTKDGQMILVAYEYLVFDSKWDPKHTRRAAPTVFGRDSRLTSPIHHLSGRCTSGCGQPILTAFSRTITRLCFARLTNQSRI